MTTEKKKRRPTAVTPVGEFVGYTNLTQPDYGTEEYPKPDGQYRVTIALDKPGSAKLFSILGPVFDEALKAAQATFKAKPAAKRAGKSGPTAFPFYKEEYAEDGETPTGRNLFTFRMAASGVTQNGPRAGQKWERSPALFDRTGAHIEEGRPIYSGSTGEIAFSYEPYDTPIGCGVSLRLEAVMVHTFAASTRSAKGYGFSVVAADGDDASTKDAIGEEPPPHDAPTPDSYDF